MKNWIALFLIITVFSLLNIATKKNLAYPCEIKINNFLSRDTAVQSYYLMSSHDTIIIRSYKDSLLAQKTDSICRILKDSCQVFNYKILIVDTSYSVGGNWDTPYGKKYRITQCQ